MDLIVGTEGGIGFPDDATGQVLEPDVVVLAGGWPQGAGATAIGANMIERTRTVGQRVVVDIDDWPDTPPENPHYDPNAAAHKVAAARAANAVSVSTPYLRRHFDTYGVRSKVCRNVIDPAIYTRAMLANRVDRGDDRAVTIGYRGLLCGFHDADVTSLRDQLPPELNYVHVGAHPDGATFAELAGVDPDRVHNIEAVAFHDGYPDLLGAGIDLAVIPYSPRPFSQAKSAIAALEWTAAGVPWIASRTDEIWNLDHHGVVRVSDGGWCERIRTLADDSERRELVLERQRHAMARRSIQHRGDPDSGTASVVDAWERVIRKALA